MKGKEQKSIVYESLDRTTWIVNHLNCKPHMLTQRLGCTVQEQIDKRGSEHQLHFAVPAKKKIVNNRIQSLFKAKLNSPNLQYILVPDVVQCQSAEICLTLLPSQSFEHNSINDPWVYTHKIRQYPLNCTLWELKQWCTEIKHFASCRCTYLTMAQYFVFSFRFQTFPVCEPEDVEDCLNPPSLLNASHEDEHRFYNFLHCFHINTLSILPPLFFLLLLRTYNVQTLDTRKSFYWSLYCQ